MSELADKIGKNLRKGGFRELASGCARFATRLVFEKKDVLLMRKDLNAGYQTVPLPKSLRDLPYEFRKGRVEDVDGIRYIDGAWKASIKAYLAAGAEIYLSIFDGTIQAYHLSHDRFILDLPRNLRIPLKGHQVYQFDGQVAPEYRGKVIGQFHMNAFEEAKLKLGFTETTCFVESENRTSMRFHERNGFQVLQSGFYIRILWFKSWKFASADSRPDDRPRARSHSDGHLESAAKA